MSIIPREVNSLAIVQHAEDGLVNLSKMAQATTPLSSCCPSLPVPQGDDSKLRRWQIRLLGR